MGKSSIMKFDEYFNLGAISKVFSFKGEIVARFDVEVPNLFDNLNAIFIEEKRMCRVLWHWGL